VGLTIPTFSSLKTFGPALAGLFFIPGGMYWHWAPISLLPISERSSFPLATVLPRGRGPNHDPRGIPPRF
jgi:hypothetical protein